MEMLSELCVGCRWWTTGRRRASRMEKASAKDWSVEAESTGSWRNVEDDQARPDVNDVCFCLWYVDICMCDTKAED